MRYERPALIDVQQAADWKAAMGATCNGGSTVNTAGGFCKSTGIDAIGDCDNGATPRSGCTLGNVPGSGYCLNGSGATSGVCYAGSGK
jgi:hypothetical protein